jgi:hypothetical protein
MKDKELMVLPVISGACILFVCALFVVPVIVALGGELPEEGQDKGIGGLIALPLYVAVYTISIFFQSAVVAGATERMDGGDPTVSSALAAAWRRKGTILLWGLVAGTIGMILRSIQERSQLIGRIVIGLVGAAWSLATFFVVPVIVLEGRPVKEAFKSSLSLFRQRWGEAAIGSGGIALFGFLLFLPVIAVCALLIAAELIVPAIALGVLAGAVLSALLSTLQGIYVAALYRYASTSETPAGMDARLLEGAFRKR